MPVDSFVRQVLARAPGDVRAVRERPEVEAPERTLSGRARVSPFRWKGRGQVVDAGPSSADSPVV